MARPVPASTLLLTGLIVGLAWLAVAEGPSSNPTLAAREQELTLARGGGFYLVLEPGRLRLMSRGVRLREYALTDLRLGVPRVAFVRRPPSLETPRVYDDGGRLLPDRPREEREVLAPDPGAQATPPAVPTPPEAAFAVPAHFRLDFDGLSLEFGPPPGLPERLWMAGGDACTAIVSLFREPRLRLRLEMSRDDRDALYRSLPPDTRLLLAVHQ